MRRLLLRGLPVLVLLILVEPALARFMRPDLEKVPVERLAANLEGMLQKNEKDKQILFNLARLHAMAYTLKTDSVEVWKGKEKNGPWLGYTPSAVPFKPVKTDDATRLKAAQEQLQKALGRYNDVLKIDPKYLPAQLGKAWLLDQVGKKDEAIKEYRAIIEAAWANEGKAEFGPLGGNFITREAAGYLIALLDAKKDEAEIDTLKNRIAKLEKLPRPVTPLVIPLVDGASADSLEQRDARVPFDADGTGYQREWSWITPQGAWLVHDPRQEGKITSALQMFGSVSFWLFWETGYDALASLDNNGDGQLTGTELHGLALWHDRNGNGKSELGEIQSLGRHGIVALSCRYERDLAHPDRIAYSKNGVQFTNGKTRPTFDLILRSAR